MYAEQSKCISSFHSLLYCQTQDGGGSANNSAFHKKNNGWEILPQAVMWLVTKQNMDKTMEYTIIPSIPDSTSYIRNQQKPSPAHPSMYGKGLKKNLLSMSRSFHMGRSSKGNSRYDQDPARITIYHHTCSGEHSCQFFLHIHCSKGRLWANGILGPVWSSLYYEEAVANQSSAIECHLLRGIG